MILSTQKRSMLPNVKEIALEAFDRLVLTLAEEKELDLSIDTSLIRILQLLLERTDLMATAITIIKQQLPLLQQASVANDDMTARVLQMETWTNKPDELKGSKGEHVGFLLQYVLYCRRQSDHLPNQPLLCCRTRSTLEDPPEAP